MADDNVGNSPILSEYAKKLKSNKSRRRYVDKLKVCHLTCDPFAMKKDEWDENPDDIPNIRQCDLHIYMVHTPSPYTFDETKSGKAMLGADSFVEAGWVHNLKLKKYHPQPGKSPYYLIIGSVKHSQTMSATHLTPWIVSEQSGTIIAAHCTCMAGLGEACSHIAAVISSVARAVFIRSVTGTAACTSQRCAWLPPSRKVSPALVKDIVFTSPSTASKKRSHPDSTSSTPSSRTLASIQPPSNEEMATFFATLNLAEKKPGILRVLDDYAANFIPISQQPQFPSPLDNLFDPDTYGIGYLDLLERCESAFDKIVITNEEITAVEAATRMQSNSKVWFLQRAGRITASNFKSAARTNPAMPAPSLIKKICYPDAFKFQTPATRWGCDHESAARKAYENHQRLGNQPHSDFVISESGFMISKDHPYIGATPDGHVSCSCCGKGIIEIKCPYTCREKLPDEEDVPAGHCMQFADGKWQLDRKHSYYYQVQAQLHIVGRDYCDFVMWSQTGIRVERLERDTNLFTEALSNITQVFKYGVLVELIGKWWTRKPVCDNAGIIFRPGPDEEEELVTTDDEEAGRLFCYCNMPSVDDLVECKHKSCKIKKFHMTCLRIRVPPKGKWFCPHCRLLKVNKPTVKPTRFSVN